MYAAELTMVRLRTVLIETVAQMLELGIRVGRPVSNAAIVPELRAVMEATFPSSVMTASCQVVNSERSGNGGRSCKYHCSPCTDHSLCPGRLLAT